MSDHENASCCCCCLFSYWKKEVTILNRVCCIKFINLPSKVTDTIRGLSHLNDGHAFDQYSLPFLTQPIKKRRDKTTIKIITHLGRSSARGKGCLNEEIFLLSWGMTPLPHTLPSYLWFSKKQYGLWLKNKIRMCILSDNQMKDKRGGPPPPKKGVCKTILILLNLLFVLKCFSSLFVLQRLEDLIKRQFFPSCVCALPIDFIMSCALMMMTSFHGYFFI